MTNDTAGAMFSQQEFVLLQIKILQRSKDTVALCKYSKCISKVFQVATPTNKKPHWLIGQFPNIYKVNKESYDSIATFIHQLK